MWVKYIMITLYFGVLILLGIIASRRIKNMSDYYVGGKKLGFWVVAFSARATGESGWLLLGLTGMGAMAGVSAYWVVIGEVLGVAIGWFLMAKRFKRLSDNYNSITIPDYLESRFKTTKHTLRIISALILAIFVVIYVSAQIDATGQAFEDFLGWNYFVGALVGFILVVAYIFSGGFVAVAWSDLFQGLLMFLGLVILPIAAYFMIDNPSQIASGLKSIDPGLLNIWGPHDDMWMNLAMLGGFAMIGLGFMGSPQVFVRFMSIKDNKEINKGRWVAIAFTFLTDAAAVTVGILGRYIFEGEGSGVTLDPTGENVLPELVSYTMPLVLTGLYVAIVLSAIMSTIDSLLVVASSAVTRDFYQQTLRPDLKHQRLTGLSRVVTIGMALVALALAMIVAVSTPDRTIFWFTIFGWSGVASAFCPVIILSLIWKGYTATGAIASMISGFISVILFKFWVPTIEGIGPYFAELDVMGPSFAVAFIVGITVSLIWPNKELKESIQLKP